MNGRRITFSADGASLEDCDSAARAIAVAALGHEFSLHCHGYHAEVQTNENVVLVWRGNYAATKEDDR